MSSDPQHMPSREPDIEGTPASFSAPRQPPHGMSAFEELIALGAFAALDQLPPEQPGAVEGRRRWSDRFGQLVSAYAAEQQGDDEAVRRHLEVAGFPLRDENATVGDAVVAGLGLDQADVELFGELFGWVERVTPELYQSLPRKFKPIWIHHVLCCALGYRRNTFGRYFGPAPAGSLPSESTLEALSEQMNEAFETPAGDSDVPAGFIFFGQFVDHTITFDVTTRLSDVHVDPTEIENVRTPALDLDNVYGDGPEASPELYDSAREGGFLLVGPQGRDVARNHQGVAVIGDPRNDENTLISQMHLHFLHFHNAVLRMIHNTPVDALWGRKHGEEPEDERGDFEFARRMVRWHYQWAVVNDWLPRVVESDTLAAAHAMTGVPKGVVVPPLPPGFETARDFFDQFHHITCCGSFICRPLMPVEFSAAAFRFAHSQVRSRYDLNADRLGVPLFVPRPPGLAAFGPVPATDLVSWERFFQLEPSIPPQYARRLDTWLSAQVFQLPFAPANPNLAFRNLLRGARVYALPTGSDVATTLSLATGMGPVALNKLTEVGLADEEAPLWFYILGEAEANAGRLGPVGGLLVAVTLFRLLQCDESSFVHESGWSPVLVPSDPGVFTVADLLRIAVNERKDAFPA